MNALAQIVEMDQERDRKTCVTLDLKVTGANHELAQWCFDHPRYSQRVIAGWLGCDHTRIFHLRKWASNGFDGSPFDSKNKPDSRRPDHSGGARHQSPLKTNDNSDAVEHDADGVVIEDEIAAPEQIEDNILYAIQRINENARAFSKILRASALDREAVERINTAVDRMIQKWRSIQSTLEKKG